MNKRMAMEALARMQSLTYDLNQSLKSLSLLIQPTEMDDIQPFDEKGLNTHYGIQIER